VLSSEAPRLGNRTDPNRLAVKPGAVSALRDEAFFPERIKDNAELDAAAPFVCDRDAELRVAVREVGGAVERIDDPSMVALMRAGAAFFGENRVSWKRAMDHFDNRGFRFAVGFGDEIDRVRLAIDCDSAEALQVNSARGGARRGAQPARFSFSTDGTIFHATRSVQRAARIYRQIGDAWSASESSPLPSERASDGRSCRRAVGQVASANVATDD